MSEKSPVSKDEVRFFNASLINAHVMSLPKFSQPQRLIVELIHSIEAANPTFAWVQFLFKRANYSPTLIALKNSIHAAAEEIKTPKRSIIDDSEYDRPELHRDWYKRFGERIKRIDAISSAPHVLLAIQGMWVGDPRLLSTLPFKDCYDEFDRLGTFPFRNPWMLVDLVDRRMVEDISSYIMSYARSRLEPPSLLLTQEEVQYYVHLPVLRQTESLESIQDWMQYSPQAPGGEVVGAKPRGPAIYSKVARLTRVPKIDEPLKDNEIQRMNLLPSLTVRGFELIYEGGRTEILLSSHSEVDLSAYAGLVDSVYGELPFEPFPEKPPFLEKLPSIVGLAAKPAPQQPRDAPTRKSGGATG